jgi:hypothetical protein
MTVDRCCVDDDHTRKLWFADSGNEVEVTERQQAAAKTKKKSSNYTTKKMAEITRTIRTRVRLAGLGGGSELCGGGGTKVIALSALGSLRFVVVPSPSWPSSFQPQHLAVSSSRMAHV